MNAVTQKCTVSASYKMKKHRHNIIWTVQDEPYILVRLLMTMRKYEISAVSIKKEETDETGKAIIHMVGEAASENIGFIMKKMERLIPVISLTYTYDQGAR